MLSCDSLADWASDPGLGLEGRRARGRVPCKGQQQEHESIYTYTYTYICIYVSMYIYIYIYGMAIYVYGCIYALYIYIYIFIYVYVYMITNLHVRRPRNPAAALEVLMSDVAYLLRWQLLPLLLKARHGAVPQQPVSKLLTLFSKP